MLKRFNKRLRLPILLLIAILLATVVLQTNVYTIAATAGTIAVNDFANYRVFQRDIGGTSKSVTITGTYADMDWSRVEARVLGHGTETAVVGWTPIDTTPGGGTFSGSLVIPQGGWYNIEVRAIYSGGTVLGSSRGTNKWGVGMLILCIGQSNMVGNGQPPFTVATSDLAVNYSNAGIWEHLADPYDDDSPPGAVDSDNDVISTYNVGGSMIPALANSLLQTFNFPIAFVPSAKGGSSLYSQWAYRNTSNHFDTSTLYGQSITKARSVGGVELIIMHQGETDATVHRSESQYEADFATLIGHYREDLYSGIPIFICQLGTVEPGTNGVTDADMVAIRNAQHDLDNSANIFMAATAMDQPRMDQVHYTIQGLNAIGGRVAQTIKYYLGAALYYRGPAITSAAFAGNRSTIDVQITHRGGNDITPASGITGFSVLNNGSPVSINSAVRISSDRIRLTLASSIPVGNTAKLQYLWGSKPNTSALVKDNSSLALPLENTTTDLTVLTANSPPVAVDDAYSTVKDIALTAASPGILSNDIDNDGNSLTAVKVSGPAHGTLALNADGSFLYSPNAGYLGNDSFTYQAYDGQADSNNANVSITINPPGTITINDFANYRVFQRDIGGTSKSVTITGTYADMNWSRVEARVLGHGIDTAVVGWTPIDSTPGGGTFSGSLVVPQGGWYDIEVHAIDSGGTVLGSSRGVNKWGVGMVILCIGQSNMVGHGQQPFTAASSDLAVNYSNAGVWEHLADPYDDDSPQGAIDNDNSTAGGSMIPALANSLLQTFDFPIAFVPSAKDGSNLYSQWAYRNPSNHFDTSTLYGQSITKAQSVGGVELIIMHQGEADTNAHRSESQYEADFATLIGHYREDLYAGIPIFICQLGTIDLVAGDARTNADVQAVRNAQHDLDNGSNIFMAATAMEQPRLDEVHYTQTGLDAIGKRMAQAIKYHLGAASYYRGPAITSAAFAGNRSTIDVQIFHRGGNDFTPASGITGFSVLSNGSPLGITSAVRIDANRIRLTLTTSAPQGAAVTLRYLWGADPDNTGLVKDNSSLVLPLENTTADITVTGTNTSPVAVSDTYSVNEDNVLTIAAPGVLSNDSDTNGDNLTAIKVTNPSHGSVTLNSNGSFTYTPAANYNGSDSFTYKANDGAADSNTATVTISINPVNDAPVAASNTYSVVQGTTLTVVVPGVLGNDTDVDGNTLTAVNISNPAHGTLTTFSADGSFTYSPNLNYTGTDSFTYQAYDGQVYSSAATVTINVTQSVSTFGLGNGNGTSNESRNYLNAMRFQNNAGTGTLTKLEILFNDSTPNGKARLGVYADNNGVPGSRLIDAGEVTVSNGWVSISSLNLPVTQNNYYWLAFNMQSTNGVTYQSGQPSRSHYRVSSTYGTLPSTFPSRPSYNSNQYVMRATVTTGGNTPPLAVGETFSTDEDTTLTVSAPGVLGNDTDTDGNPLTAVKVTNPAHGTLTTFNADGSFTYSPSANYNGNDSFTYKVNDGQADSNTATVTININPVNDTPVAVSNTYSVTQGTTLTVASPGVLGNDIDVDGNSLTAINFSNPAHGTLTTFNADGSFTYSPNLNYNGSDSFTYQAYDGQIYSNTATVTIDVVKINTPPVASGNNYTTDEDKVLNTASPGVLEGDSDAEGDSLTAVLVNSPTHGTLTLNASGSFTYTPTANYNGNDSFTYKASDGQATSNTATVSLTINAVNDPPVAVNDAYSTSQDASLTANAPGVLTNDSDAEGNSLTAVLINGPTHGTLTLNASGSFSYIPTAGYTGTDIFTYKANDGQADSNSATATIQVTAPTTPSSSLSFGGNDYVTFGDLDLTSSFTLEFWMKANSKTGWASVLMKNSDYGLEFDPQGRLSTSIYNGGTWGGYIYYPGITTGQWHHIAMVWDEVGNDLFLYVDGVMVGSDLNRGDHQSNNNPLRIGAWTTGSEYFNGLIDEVRISNFIRYTSNFTPPPTLLEADTGTVALWHLDEGSGQTVTDNSGHGWNGVLGSSTAVQSSDPAWSTDSPINK